MCVKCVAIFPVLLPDSGTKPDFREEITVTLNLYDSCPFTDANAVDGATSDCDYDGCSHN